MAARGQARVNMAFNPLMEGLRSALSAPLTGLSSGSTRNGCVTIAFILAGCPGCSWSGGRGRRPTSDGSPPYRLSHSSAGQTTHLTATPYRLSHSPEGPTTHLTAVPTRLSHSPEGPTTHLTAVPTRLSHSPEGQTTHLTAVPTRLSHSPAGQATHLTAALPGSATAQKVRQHI